MALFKRAKKAAPVVEEKKTPTITEMKVKYKLFDGKVKEYIKKQQTIVDRHIQRATELKLKGLDASTEIKRIAFFQSKMRAAEKRRAILEMQLENYEAMEFDKEFLGTISEMTSFLGAFEMDAAEIEAVTKNIMDANLKLATAQESMNSKMDELDSAFASIDALSGADSLQGVENSINALIDKTISDAAFSAAETSPEEIARSVSNKLKIEE